MSFESNSSGVDPRVQIELEKLNTATDDINKLEVQIEEAKCDFKKLLTESVEKIKQSAHKIGNSIEAAKPYYEARIYANELVKGTQIAAVDFEKAKSIHAAAKEMVNLAEQGVGEKSPLDAACQEMLSHATSRVHESQLECTDARNVLKICELKQEVASNRVGKLQSQLKGAIKASRPYYETRANYNGLLKAQKAKISKLETQVSEAKMTYNEALTNLEKISEEIHRMRQERLNLNNFAVNNYSNVDNNKIDGDIPTTINLQPLHSGLNDFSLSDDESEDYTKTSNKNNYYSSRIDSCDEYLEFPPKISFKSSPIRQQKLDDHDCPHLLNDFPSHFIGNGGYHLHHNHNHNNHHGYHGNNSDDDKLKETTSSGISNDLDDIEQWTEIRLSNSESTSSGYSHHELGVIIDDRTPPGSDTSESDDHRKVTCTTVFNDNDSDRSKRRNTESSGISSWISRSNSLKGSGRRQSLDLLIDASDKVASVFQKVGKSLERRNSESETTENSDFFSFSRSDKDILSDEQVENLLLDEEEQKLSMEINGLTRVKLD